MTHQQIVRLGIVGLGQRWQKQFKPALMALQRHFRIAAVTDHLGVQAHREAKELQCAEARGVVELLRFPDIDAVLLADEQWYGMWPLEMAAEFGKPIYCAVDLRSDEAHLNRIQQKLEEKPIRVMMDFPLRKSPLLARLADVANRQIGAAKLLFCTITEPHKSEQPDCPISVSLAHLDMCLQLFAGNPIRIQNMSQTGEMLRNTIIEFEDGRAVQISRSSMPGLKRSLQMQVIGEKGIAVAEFPNRLHWSNLKGQWCREIRSKLNARHRMLKEFHRCVTNQSTPKPSWNDAFALWQLQTDLR